MDYFADIEQVEAAGGSGRFTAGIYPALRIDSTLIKPDGYTGSRFIVEATVVATPKQTDPEILPAPVGTKRSWTVQINGPYAKIGKKEVKRFLMVATGGDVTAQVGRDAVDPVKQTLRGTLIRSEASVKTTKSNRKMTKHTWAPVLPTTQIVEVPDAEQAPAPAAAAAPSVPAVPSVPAAAEAPKLSLEERATAAGWLLNPSNPPGGTYWYNTATGDQKLLADLEDIV